MMLSFSNRLQKCINSTISWSSPLPPPSSVLRKAWKFDSTKNPVSNIQTYATSTGNSMSTTTNYTTGTYSHPNVNSKHTCHINTLIIHKSYATSASATNQNTKCASEDVIKMSLKNVHEYGWTDDAIANAILELNYPPSFMGRLSDSITEDSNNNINTMSRPFQLISYFMQQCNIETKRKLNHEFHNHGPDQQLSIQDLLFHGIQTRLKMNIPYIQSKRWHEAMALGVLYPSHAYIISTHLEALGTILLQFCVQSSSSFTGALNHNASATITNNRIVNEIEKSAIMAIYIATELHMLEDNSLNYQDTWSFLQARIQEYSLISSSTASAASGWTDTSSYFTSPNDKNSTKLNTATTIIATTAIASSMIGAIQSILLPVTKIGVSALSATIVPQIISFASSSNTIQSSSSSSTMASSTATLNNNSNDDSVVWVDEPRLVKQKEDVK